MKRIFVIFWLSFFGLFSENGLTQNTDTTVASPQQLKRVLPVSLGVGSVWAGGIIGLHSIWYKDFEKTKFHTFSDGADWMQMDKAGHFYTAAHLCEANYRLFEWTGLSKRTSAWIGAGIGLGFQTSLEFLDGTNAQWGFSWYDMLANTLGAGWFLGQQTLWDEQRLLIKFSYHLTEFAAYRPQILGATFTERLLKDYNGQTYWISFSPTQFIENCKLPTWLCFSFGYSAEEKLVGNQDFYVAANRTFQARRQYLFSLDLDVRELPIKNKWLKAVLRPLHYLKFPFPALILDGNKMTGSWLYF
ncbi:MAG: DUF2279 domain-containing protein [Crocinitomicaceae bacterium]